MTTKKVGGGKRLALAVELRPIGELTPYARNSRKHSPEQVVQLRAAMVTFGWTIPTLVDEAGGMIAGHGRVMAAEGIYADGGAIRMAGGEEIPAGMVPVMVARGWSEAQKRAYVIADNKLAENASWDDELLALELGDLQDDEFDLTVLGFDQDELDKILDFGGTDGETDPDDVPEVRAVAVSAPGDIWVLEHHRIACGDSTNVETVELLLRGEKPHLMVTDPPYGVEYDPEWRNKAGVAGKGTAKGKVLNDDQADWRAAWELFPGDVAYVWHAGLFAGVVAESLIATDFVLRSQIVWNKGQLVLSRGDYHWQHEPAWYAVRKGGKSHWNGDRKQTTVWDIAKPRKSDTGHGTQKPVECMQRPMENNSEPGDAIYEPFSGSGTSIIAGEKTGRRVFAVELNPAYVDVAVRRWEAFTGKEARLESSGRTFAEEAVLRTPQAA
ncbi:MAG: site-specific DNA-methyltransferase [Alsobacter sp.]